MIAVYVRLSGDKCYLVAPRIKKEDLPNLEINKR